MAVPMRARLMGAALAGYALVAPLTLRAFAQYPPIGPVCSGVFSILTPGEIVQFSGENWLPGGTVRIAFGPSRTVLAETETDRQGEFRAQGRIPITAPPGDARVAFEGAAPDGRRTTCNMTVTLARPPVEPLAPALVTPGSLLGLLAIAGLVIALLIRATMGRRETPQSSTP